MEVVHDEEMLKRYLAAAPATISEYTKKIARELHVVKLMNIQYAIMDDIVYILEANPRASRTVPLVSKVCNVSMARIATQRMLGKN
jgi:carbamoyl-phosphate synthase large subunit